MASLSRNAGNLTAGGAAAHDQYSLSTGRRFKTITPEFPLTTGRRIDETADPVVSMTSGDTLLVTRETGANVLGATQARFSGKMRVGDLTPHDADEVGLP